MQRLPGTHSILAEAHTTVLLQAQDSVALTVPQMARALLKRAAVLSLRELIEYKVLLSSPCVHRISTVVL